MRKSLLKRHGPCNILLHEGTGSNPTRLPWGKAAWGAAPEGPHGRGGWPVIPVLIFFCSVAGVCQFGIHYWRATISSVAAQAVSDRAWAALGISSTDVKPRDFRALMSLSKMAPALRGSNGGLRTIQAYYLMIETMGRALPMMAGWAEREMIACARFAAARLVQ